MRYKNELFHALIQHSSNIISVLSADGTALYQSPSIKRMLGYEPSELIGCNVFGLVHPDDLPSVMDAFGLVLKDPTVSLTAEFRCKHKDESWRVIEATGTNQIGNPLIEGVVVNSRDVTERRKAEEFLHRARKEAEDERARTDAILASISDAISIQDASFTVEYQNPAHRALVGGDKAGERCYTAYACSDRICDGCPVALSLSDGKVHTLEKRVHREGGVMHIEIKGSPLRDSEGNVIAVVEMVRDVTERKMAEQILQESEERFRRVFEDAPLGMVMTSPDCRILRVNRALCKMVDYGEGELVGRTMEELIYPEDRQGCEALSKKLLGNEIPLLQMEKRYVKKEGDVIWVNFTATAIRGLEGEVLCAIAMVEDITRRKIADREREWLIERLQESLNNVKTLKGLLPMCAWCKKIRDDRGYWTRVEAYIREHSEASFTHGICPDCLMKHDPLTYAEIHGSRADEWPLPTERRRSMRMNPAKPLDCLVTLELGNWCNSTFGATVENLSEGGLCMRADSFPAQGSMLAVRYQKTERRGIVKWAQADDSDSTACRFGVAFV
ncbi:MAG: PAS domain S-box protein [Chloroflexota bacterium]